VFLFFLFFFHELYHFISVPYHVFLIFIYIMFFKIFIDFNILCRAAYTFVGNSKNEGKTLRKLRELLIDLDVEVDNVLFVHVLQSFADLTYVANHLGLGHLVTLVGDLVEQLAARQAAQHTRPTHSSISSITASD